MNWLESAATGPESEATRAVTAVIPYPFARFQYHLISGAGACRPVFEIVLPARVLLELGGLNYLGDYHKLHNELIGTFLLAGVLAPQHAGGTRQYYGACIILLFGLNGWLQKWSV